MALRRNLVDVTVALEVVLGSRIVAMLGTHCLPIRGPRAFKLAKVRYQESNFSLSRVVNSLLSERIVLVITMHAILTKNRKRCFGGS